MIWYEDEVKRLENERLRYTYMPDTVFYGSSSIRLWATLYTDFESYKPVNLGFGGSTLAACVWFFERVVAPLQPKQIIFYAGDNDLGDGRHPEEIFIFFQQLLTHVSLQFGKIPIAFISIKPSIVRWAINDKILYTNKLIENLTANVPNLHYIDIYAQMTDDTGTPRRELFVADGLHLSEKGYEIWKTAVLNYLKK